ncbi:MAG: tRNA epoxyqueuosine(34) reductase QueG [Verrucomicrobia bacterium]|nr:tRNA epoxyqueuosine(34) reductase QueG [Verrucomicrobiota bacterium]
MRSREGAELVRKRARELGFDDCRITTASPPASAGRFLEALGEGRHAEMQWLARNADKRVNPELVLPGAQSLVVVAASYGGEWAEEGRISTGTGLRGVVARYARHRDYHEELGRQLGALTQSLDAWGRPETRSLWYVDTGPVLERDLAQRAGIGFVGKHTNLISRQLGNWFLIGEILTTLALETDAPERNRCGSCSRCLTACPTQALPAPFTLDARRCISYLTIEHKGSIPEELRPLIGDRIFGCDDCLAACPWNRFARTGALMKAQRRADLENPDLVNLLRLDDAGFKQQFAGTPLYRTKRRGVLRNVCVALGNVGDVSVLPELDRAARDSEPLIAEHAKWAIERIRERAKTSAGVATPGFSPA